MLCCVALDRLQTLTDVFGLCKTPHFFTHDDFLKFASAMSRLHEFRIATLQPNASLNSRQIPTFVRQILTSYSARVPGAWGVFGPIFKREPAALDAAGIEDATK